MNVLSSVATFYKEGGLFMHAVLVIGILVVAIVIERVIVIHRATVNGRKMTDDLVKAVGRGDLSGARNLANQSSAPLARVAQAMFQTGSADEAILQSAADDSATLTLPDLTRRLPHLSMFANSATLIGLLGTITGLITAISGIGVADAAQRSAYLAAGISEALHCTAFGLMIAIPTLMIQGWLSGRVEGIAQDVDELSIRLSRALGHASANRAGAPHIAAVPTRHVAPGSTRLASGGGC